MTTAEQYEALPALLQLPFDDPRPNYNDDDNDDDDDEARQRSEAERKPLGATARVFQCPKCECLLKDPVQLPCGNTICRMCLPPSEPRPSIDSTLWPGTADRHRAINCPCCPEMHASAGCWSDRLTAELLSSVEVFLAGPCQSTKLGEAFNMLSPGCDPEPGGGQQALGEDDGLLLDLRELDRLMRQQMDCGICYQLLYEPWTTPCGHVFCRHCIKRALEQGPIHSPCPACRGIIALPYLDNRLYPSNKFLQCLATHFWSSELQARRLLVRSESPYPNLDETGMDVPIFVCAVAIPHMPTFLHIFEPRYRAMVLRIWAGGEGGKCFGMVWSEDAAVGVHLRIEAATFLPDGRSLLETQGGSRFRLKRRSLHQDGYWIADVEDFPDVSLYEEERREVADFSLKPESSELEPLRPSPADVLWMKTKALSSFAFRSITHIAATNPRWLTSRILSVYGPCPDDAALFPWWFAGVCPIPEEQKIQLLNTTSVRERVKICCLCLLRWESPERF